MFIFLASSSRPNLFKATRCPSRGRARWKVTEPRETQLLALVAFNDAENDWEVGEVRCCGDWGMMRWQCIACDYPCKRALTLTNRQICELSARSLCKQ